MANDSAAVSLTSQDIRRFRKLLVFTAIMVFLLIIMGGIVRVTGSGLGCPDWPKCFGNWFPPMRLDAIIEYLHRLIATLTSPFMLASAVIAWRRFRQHKLIYRPLIWSVALLGVQGLLGGIVVLLETPPDLVAVHLGNALLILGLIIVPAVISQTLDSEPNKNIKFNFDSKIPKLARWTTIALFIVLISGALVAGGNATESCPGWPLCNGVLFPNHLPGWIHMTHRFLVVATSVLITYLAILANKTSGISPAVKSAATFTVVLFFTQALIGAIKVTTNFPILMLGLHVVNAAAVWAASIVLTTRAGLSENTNN